MAIILSLESSTSVCSVALHHDGRLLSTLEVHKEFSHASKLAILVQEVAKLADVRIGDIAAVAVSAGPGSYTGLRIGTSLAKGLCYALDVPLIAVPTLKIMARMVCRINTADAFLCPMIDARRMEVYCQLFDHKAEEQESVRAQIIDENSFAMNLKLKPVIFFGDGAEKCRQYISHVNARFLNDVKPLASHLGELAFLKYQKEEVENLVEFVPFYLKDFYFKKPVEA
jgi:tRNA threonylcarbamoyladenosine biosynthesis protein TsaB